MKITFYGGVESTTGSKHLLEVDDAKILLDCGMFQGSRKKAFKKNKEFPFDPAGIDTVLLSHAHIDHCGSLPNLHKQGYGEKVFCTHATRDLAAVMLKDSAYIQMKDAEYLKKRKKEVVGPIYNIEDAEQTIWHFASVSYHQKFRIHPRVKVEFLDAGHILGSAITKINVQTDEGHKDIVYAVDLGRKDLPILRDPEHVGTCDYLIIESTYGGRYHNDIRNAGKQLAEVVNRAYNRGGKVIIPAFSLERTQEIVYVLRGLISEGTIPDISVYIDSPLAVNVTDIYRLHPECFDTETNRVMEEEEDPFGTGCCVYVRSVDASKRLNATSGSHIIISASGMCEAGRILHHLLHNIEHSNNTVLFTGYQAEGTLGRRIINGVKEIKIFGDMYKMNAEVEEADTFSGHADENDLVDYVARLDPKPEKVFLVHGEEKARTRMQQILKEKTGVNAIMPKEGEGFELR